MRIKKFLGFTLIELLIVIAIIGILAVALLPSIMGSPAKGRDAARIADLQKIQKVLINANLEGKTYPNTTGDIVDALSTGWASPANTWSGAFAASFGGSIPKDPQTGSTGNVQFKYYKSGDTAIGGSSSPYSFGLRAKMETKSAGNTPCIPWTGVPADSSGTSVIPAFNLKIKPPTDPTSCYVILSQ